MASALSPKYRIGPSDFFTGGDLAADAATLDGQVDELDTQIEGNDQVNQNLADQWTAWHAQWKAFKDDHFGGFFSNLLSAFNDSNRDQLIQFETQFANFAAQFQQQGLAGIAAGVVQPSAGSGDTLGAQAAAQLGPGAGGLATKGIVILVLVIVAIFVWREVK